MMCVFCVCTQVYIEQYWTLCQYMYIPMLLHHIRLYRHRHALMIHRPLEHSNESCILTLVILPLRNTGRLQFRNRKMAHEVQFLYF